MKTCESCGGEMAKAREIERGLQLVSLALFVLGVALLFLFPAGTIIGGALIFGVLALGYSQKKIWKCRGCGHSLARVLSLPRAGAVTPSRGCGHSLARV